MIKSITINTTDGNVTVNSEELGAYLLVRLDELVDIIGVEDTCIIMDYVSLCDKSAKWYNLIKGEKYKVCFYFKDNFKCIPATVSLEKISTKEVEGETYTELEFKDEEGKIRVITLGIKNVTDELLMREW